MWREDWKGLGICLFGFGVAADWQKQEAIDTAKKGKHETS